MSNSDERDIITQIKKRLMHDELQLKHYGVQIKATTDTVKKIKGIIEKQQEDIVKLMLLMDERFMNLEDSNSEQQRLLLLKKNIMGNNRQVKRYLETILRGE